MLTQLATVLATLTLVMMFGYHIIIYLGARRHVHRLTSLDGDAVPRGSCETCVSIVVPTKGEPLDMLASATKAKAEAIKKSSLRCGEVLIISDDDADYVRELKKALRPYVDEGLVKVIRRENPSGGRTGALDYGAKVASGEYVLILDSDSKVSAETLSALHAKICTERPPAVVLPWKGYSLMDTRLAEAIEFNTDTTSFLLYKLRWAGGFFIFPLGSGTAVRKDVLEEVGYWGPNVIQDDIWLGTKLAGKGYMPDLLPEGSTEVLVPAKLKSFRIQQSRWAYGASEIISKTLDKILKSPLPLGTRLEMVLYVLQPSISIPLTVASILAFIAAFVEPGWDVLKALHSMSIMLSAALAELVILTYAALHINLGKIIKSAKRKAAAVQLGRAAAVYGVLYPVIGFYSLLGLLRIKLSYKITPKAGAEEELKGDWVPYLTASVSGAGIIASAFSNNIVAMLLMLLSFISSVYSIVRLE
ncbi:MAG: glycosyltransferase family 2 protein [Desulfurococcales archaeon]|nr:glycosyltransferase family 2 protein [Desulfurococcales archaeon]